MVADEQLPTGAGDDDEPALGEPAALEPEDEEPVVPVHRCDQELERRRVLDPGPAADARDEGVRQQGAGEVDDPALEEPEVRPADVDQVVRRPPHPGCQREERDDQPHSDRDAGRRQRAPRRPPEQVPEDEVAEGHEWIFARGTRAPSEAARTLVL